MGSRKKLRLDFGTVVGIILAIGGIIAGLVLEKGNVRDVEQITAALIVFAGTAGAVMVTTPASTLKSAISSLRFVFFEVSEDRPALVENLIAFATKARRHGIISLEQESNALPDPFLRKAMNLAVDGTDLDGLKTVMELEIDLAYQRLDQAAGVFESGGGYSPTIGIIGAVLGLIQVMKNLANIQEVGHGIAVAFVATVYGVGLANIFLLPAAAKVRSRARSERQTRELALLGVVGILEGLNPKVLRTRLNSYLDRSDSDFGGGKAARSYRAA